MIEISAEDITNNVFKLIGSNWMLISAGGAGGFNTMTASWGGFGVLWNRNICICFVRPVRHTYKFMELSGYFSLSFFDDQYRGALLYCGSHSGRDVDKPRETGLTPVFTDESVYFREAQLVIEAKKIYTQDLDPARFIDSNLEDNYPNKDYHRMYVGEIIRCLSKDR